MKTKLVLFEGADKTGKDTLYTLYRKATLWGPLAIVRFTGSNIVHDIHYNRGRHSFQTHVLEERKLMDLFDVYLVLLVGDTNVLAERSKLYDPEEDKEKAVANLAKIQEQFISYYRLTPFKNKIMLNTTDLSAQECLDQILKFTEEERGEEDWKKAVSLKK